MTVLLDLLSPYPILENIVSSLGIGDLLNLSKVNSIYRVALHGFQQLPDKRPIAGRGIRSTLWIGYHRTAFWENLKTRSELRCSESHHIRGSCPTGCLICSAPVCEACIIKASFAKRNENTFQKRHRPLCSQCWYTGNQHKKHRVQAAKTKSRKPYPDQALDGEFCTCTAKNGHLCLGCKTEQNNESVNGSELCYGQDCPSGGFKSKITSMEGRICLWCSLQLPGSRSRAESRRNYDARHLLARSISSYDRPNEDGMLESFEQQRMLEDDTRSRQREDDENENEDFESLEEQRALEDDIRSRKTEEHRLGASLISLQSASEGLFEVARYGHESEILERSEEMLRRHELPPHFADQGDMAELPSYEEGLVNQRSDGFF